MFGAIGEHAISDVPKNYIFGTGVNVRYVTAKRIVRDFSVKIIRQFNAKVKRG